MAKGNTQELLGVQESKISDVLRVVGTYSPAFSILVSSCAQLAMLRDKAFKEAYKSRVVLEETSRENDKRKKANPSYELYLKINAELRNVLVELNMTPHSSSFAEGDALDELNKKLEEIYKSYEDS